MRAAPLCLAGALLLTAASLNDAATRRRDGMPSIVLWARERPEDLRFIDPDHVGDQLRRGDASLLDDDEEPIDASVRADAVEHAIARWRAASSLPWLTAAMMLAPAGHPIEAELTRAAAAIAPSSPAWPTLAFHRVRLLLARDQFEPAGHLLAEIRRASPNPDPAFDNLLRAAELRVAPSLEALLIAGVRRRLGDGGYVEDVIDDEKDRELELGDDVVDILNERLPLSLLMRAADNQGCRLPGAGV